MNINYAEVSTFKMTIKFKLAVILFTLLTFFSTCTPRFDCADTKYSFEMSVKAYPDTDSINIGDTIWIQIESSVILQDIISGKDIDYSNAANLGTDISFDQFLGEDVSSPCATCFNFDLINGTFLQDSFNSERNLDYQFDEIAGKYLFKLGIVPKMKGIFSLAVGNSANVYRKNDACTKAGFSITFSDTDQHMYLYEQNRPGYTPSEYEQTHKYNFKVVE